MSMIATLAAWVRRREHPLADRAYRLAKAVRTLDLPVTPLHRILYKGHLTVTGLLGWAMRTVYWVPLFRTRLEGSSRRLHLAGTGMPLVTGPVRIHLGDDCRLSTAMTISGRTSSHPAPEIFIGDNVGIGWQTTIAVGSRIVIEDNVRMGGRNFLAGYPGHPMDPVARAAGLPDSDDQVGAIVLRRDVWIGTGCVINGGVEIGAGTIVAAGSVVTKSLPAGVLAAGAPARVVRHLTFGRDNVVPLDAASSQTRS